MSADPVNLATARGPVSSQARKPSNSAYDPGKPGFAQTLAERRQANPTASERLDQSPAQPAKASPTEGRTDGTRHSADAASNQTQHQAKSQAKGKNDSPARAESEQSATAGRAHGRPSTQQATRTDALAGNVPGEQAPADTVRVADLTKSTTGEVVKIANATSANESTSDDSRALHGASDEATAKDGDPHADKKAQQPLIGLIDPAPLAQNVRIAGNGNGNDQSDKARLTRGGGEGKPAGSALQAQARARGARTGANPQLQRTDLASALGQAEGGASAQDPDSIGFARHVQRVLTRAADGAGVRGPAADAGNTPSSLATLASAAHVSSSATASAASPAAAAAPAGAVFTGALNAPVGSDVWSQAVTRQSLRLSHADGGRAELTLYPRDLGQLQVSLKMGEQAQLHFSSPHAHVRAAIESALPQLRHAFADSGIALGDTSVSDQRPQQNFSDERRRPASVVPGGAVAATAEPGITAAATSVPMPGRSLSGGIDIFA